MADCIQVVNGKREPAPLRYKAPRKAIVSRTVFDRVEPAKGSICPFRYPKSVIDTIPQVKAVCALSEIGGTESQQVDLARIISAAVRVSGFSAMDLKSPRRFKGVCHVRQAVMYLGCKLTPLSLPTIGGLLGGRDHSTIAHGRDKVAQNYELFRPLIEAILAEDAVLSKAVDGLGISQEVVSPYADEHGMVTT